MTYDDVCAHFKSAANAARKLALSRAALSLWKKKKSIPHRSQLYIQEKTRGKLKADDR